MSDFIRIRNSGAEVLITPVGASVRSLFVKDREGRYRDIVLGYETEEEYFRNPAALGAVVGRYAGRISKASFSLSGENYTLDKNEGENCLHSGFSRYETRRFTVAEAQESSVRFELESPDGDQGFPGNARISVRYTLKGSGLCVEYRAETDRDTVFNLTNHSYFNLSGHASGPVDRHHIQVAADRYIELDGEDLPTGITPAVEGTNLDLRGGKQLTGSYDHAFVLSERAADLPCARLYSEESGIGMDVFTDRPALIVYTAEYLQIPSAKDGAAYGRKHAVCFETENYPDAMNHPAFPQEIYTRNRPFTACTEYRFYRT